MSPDFPLLGLLARKPASGYELGKWLRTEGRFLGRSRSMTPVYRALNDFAERGWVTTEVHDPDGGPSAKLHRLTPAGRKALVEWAETPYVPAERPMSPDFTVRLNFAGQLGPAYALQIVRAELDFRRQQRVEEGYPKLPSHDADPIPEVDADWLTYIDAITHDRGWQNTSLLIGWLETTERRLAELANSESSPTQSKEVA